MEYLPGDRLSPGPHSHSSWVSVWLGSRALGAKGCTDCGLEDCGLELASPRCGGHRPSRSPFSSADPEPAHKVA
eukprot:13237678-Alexandrium_andersonii.AAC.1